MEINTDFHRQSHQIFTTICENSLTKVHLVIALDLDPLDDCKL